MSKNLPMLVAAAISIAATGYIVVEKKGITLPNIIPKITTPASTSNEQTSGPTTSGKSISWTIPKETSQVTFKYLDAKNSSVFERTFDSTPGYSIVIEAK